MPQHKGRPGAVAQPCAQWNPPNGENNDAGALYAERAIGRGDRRRDFEVRSTPTLLIG
jgi:hypothetical protein